MKFLYSIFFILSLIVSLNSLRMDKYYKQKFKVKVLKEGDYPEYPQKGDKVKVHYTGRTMEGKKFDSSRDKGEPFEFTLGIRNVIICWDMVVSEMTIGDHLWVTCKSDMAYGDQAVGEHIKPNSDLKFEIELLEFGNHKAKPLNKQTKQEKKNDEKNDDMDDL